jgi:hypothetical protein
LDPDGYEDLPVKQRSVTVNAFRTIHDTIWEKWYLPLTEQDGYWDDQDLVRTVLAGDHIPPAYGAVVCDEAQDLTRIEIQAVLRLSLFSRYELNPYQIYNVPFAFAGDPFQTLNPTGFRWDGVKAAFYDQVVLALDPERKSRVDINFVELGYNYRSSEPIVQFANQLQLYRRAALGLVDVKPQVAWRPEGGIEPEVFVLEETVSPTQLASDLSAKVVVVPCDENGELTFVEQDGLLRTIFPQSAESVTPKNVFSAVRAKGLEFKDVILYGFGTACGPNVWDSAADLPEDQRLAQEYFLNKLYVAATRAMDDLRIVDTREGFSNLWEPLVDRRRCEALLITTEERERWGDKLPALHRGMRWREQGKRDLTADAEELRRKGRAQRDSDLLRRASRYYLELGDQREADLCEAWARRYERRFRDAGHLFSQYRSYDEAYECYWEGLCWDALDALGQNAGTGIVLPHAAAMAALMIAAPEDAAALQAFTSFLQGVLDGDHLGSAAVTQWRAVVSEYVRRLRALPVESLAIDDWRNAGVVLQAVAKAGFRDARQIIGELLARGGDHAGAVEAFEAAGATSDNTYLKLKAQAVGLPQGLQYLKAANANDDILSAWEAAGGLDRAATRPWLSVVVPTLESMKRWPDAFYAHIRLGTGGDELAEAFRQANGGRLSHRERRDLRRAYVEVLLERGQWSDAIQLFRTGESAGDLRGDDAISLACRLLRSVALSELTPDALAINVQQDYRSLAERVLASNTWQSYMTPMELGAALERIGEILTSLRHYERFLDDPSIGQTARQRWVVSKQRQADQQRRRSPDRAVQYATEATQRARQWGLKLGDLPPYPYNVAARVSGLPPGFTERRLVNGIREINFGSIEIRVRGKVLVMTNQDDLSVVRVERVDGTWTVACNPSGVAEPQADGSIRFSHSHGWAEGSISPDGDGARIQLQLLGAARPAQIVM